MRKKNPRFLTFFDGTNQKGLSLIEVMFAGSLMLVIAVGAASFLPAGLRSSNRSKADIASTQATNEVLEKLSSISFANLKPYSVSNEDSYIYQNSTSPRLADTTTINMSSSYTPVKISLDGSAPNNSSTEALRNYLEFPHKLTINNTHYRVDLIILKGKQAYLSHLQDPFASDSGLLPSFDLAATLGRVTDWVVPPVQAATSCTFSASTSAPTIGQSVSFSASGLPSYTYHWSFGDLETATGDTAAHSYATAGSFQVVVVAKKSGKPDVTCTGSSVQYVSPAALAIETTPTNGTGYVNTTSFVFTVNNCQYCDENPSNVNYRWSVDGAVVSEGVGAAHRTLTRSFSTTGSKAVAVTATTPIGNFSTNTTISVDNAEASIGISPSNSGLVGSPFTFTGDCSNCGSSPVYTWEFGDYGTATGQSVSHTYTEIGGKNVILRITGGGNPTVSTTVNVTDTKSAELTATPSSGIAGAATDPTTTNFLFNVGAAGFDATLPLTYTLTADVGDLDGDNSEGVSSFVDVTPGDATDAVAYFLAQPQRYAKSGTYTARLVVTNGTQTSQKSVNVTALARAVIDASPTTTAVNQTVTLSGANSKGVGVGATYSWSFGDGTTGTGVAVTKSWPTPGNYTVQLTISGGGLSTPYPSASRVISVQADSNTLAANQSYMKKVFVRISPWTASPTQARDALATMILLKAEN